MASGTLTRFTHDLKGFPKAEELAKTCEAGVKTANAFHPGGDEGGIEEPLEVVPEVVTNGEPLELEWEHRAEKEAREGKLEEMEKKDLHKDSQRRV